MIKRILLVATIILSFVALSPATIAKTKVKPNPRVIFQTNLGDITVELYIKKAPVTTQNFLNYVNSGFYDGLIFHRVIPDFVIQSGGFTKNMTQKQPEAPIKNEANNGLLNQRGTLSMARSKDPDSATSQFFINLKNNQSLDDSEQKPGYAVFGKVIRGMDVVDKIASISTVTYGLHKDVPVTPIIIKTAKEIK